MQSCCVRDCVKDAVLRDPHVLAGGVSATLESECKEVTEALETLGGHTQNMDLGDTSSSWKSGLGNPEDLEQVMGKANDSIALLKGGLIQSVFKQLREACLSCVLGLGT